jgi:thioesterase domain-containing protein
LPAKQDGLRKEIRRDINQAADIVRREMRTFKKDLLTGSKSWKQTAQKAVQESAPKVSKALDELIAKADEVFSRTMATVDKQAHDTQINLLHVYRRFLKKRVELVDQRLKKSRNKKN